MNEILDTTYLDKVERFLRVLVVLSHDVGVHESLASEETEASGTAEYTTHHMLG